MGYKLFDQDVKKNLLEIAERMLLAARTAPKGRGEDNTFSAIAEGNTIKDISKKMIEIGERHNQNAFLRDAQNILNSPVIVLIGTRIKSMNLKKCGRCGFKNCDEKNQYSHIPCAFNTGDLGIAIGSAVSIAMDNRVDNRIMYTVGEAVMGLEIFPEEVKCVYGIPLSAGPKNIFFDRK